LSTWRLASNYGAGLLSNVWYPSRINSAGDGLERGSLGLAIDAATNLGTEFWPDFKKAVKKTLHIK
jgi:hypothetical protein